MRDETSAPVDQTTVDQASASGAGPPGGQAPHRPDSFDPTTVSAGAGGTAIGGAAVQATGNGTPYSGTPYSGAPSPAMQSLAVAGARSLADRDPAAGVPGADAAPAEASGGEQTFEMHVSAAGGDGQARAMRMLTKVLVAVRSELSEPVQTELSELLITLQSIREEQMYHLLDSLDIAVSLLLVSDANLGVARRIRENVNARMERRSFTKLIRRNPAPANVALGMFAFLLLMSPVLILMWLHIFQDRAEGTVYTDPDVMVFLVVSAGILGSATSIMTRVSKLRASFDAGPFLIFLNGFFRPLIGASFALFLYAALNSGVISVTLPAASSYPFFYTALCFIAGFSEQLVPDLIQKVERNLSTQQIDVSERRSG